MTEDEQQIRIMIERWPDAVHEGDLQGVLADRTDDIVMFDVPPQELAEQPANRLRLTLWLRKERGRWVVAHEHHSFPHVHPDTAI